MPRPTPSGKRLAVAVTSAGITEVQLNQALGDRGFGPVMMVPSLSELTAQLKARSPSLVVVPVSMAGNSAEFASFEAELRRAPATAAIGTAPAKDADTVLAAMRAGVLEFLVTPTDDDELHAVIRRVLSLATSNVQQGRLYTVYSSKGGLGTSTLAVSLSWEFSQRVGKDTAALVDFATAGSGLRAMLDLQPMYDLGSVAARTDRIDRDFLRSVMVPHAEGVSVLAAADELDSAELLDAPSAGRRIDVLRQEYANIVIDADHHFSDPTLAALDAADRILLVTQLDVAALRSTQRTLGVFTRLGYPAEKVVVIVNRRSDRDRIDTADAEKVLGRSIDFRLPNDYASCSDAITNGQFVQRLSPNSPLVAGFSQIASTLSGRTSGAGVSNNGRVERSRLARLFGRR